MLFGYEIITAEIIQKEYRLSDALAREIVAEETQRTLRRSAIAWLILLCGVGLSGVSYFIVGSDNFSGVWVLAGSLGAWVWVGRHLAGPAIRWSAQAKAARLASLHTG